MDIQNRKRKAWLKFMLMLLLCSVMLILILGTAWARYEENVSKEFQMKYQAKTDQIYMKSIELPQNLDVSEDAYVTAFEISNGTSAEEYCEYSQIAEISLFATIGLENPENYKIVLNDSGQNFEASCTEAVKGTKLYSMYGPGWIYRFYNEAGEELSWMFPGGKHYVRTFTITIEGSSELPTALSIIASAKPGE